MTDREQEVREKAYWIWEQEGRPEGQDKEHWQRASREIGSEEQTSLGENRGDDGHVESAGSATGLQPGGTVPGSGPGASEGSIGTGGGSTGGASTGSVRRSSRKR